VHGSIGGTEEFQELHTPFTNSNGLASFEIGAGDPINGTMDMIDWANGPYFIRTEVDPSNTSNFSIVGTTELLAVPYALHAGSDGDWDDDGSAVSVVGKNVGIGTSVPQALLDIDGDILVNGLTLGTGQSNDPSNCVFGYGALAYSESGQSNVAIGGDAMANSLETLGNTAIGYGALSYNSTGSTNTAIGVLANVSPGDLNNATAIGANAIVSQSNSLVLGSSGVRVGIGTSQPDAKLHVNGDALIGGLTIGRGPGVFPNALSNTVIGNLAFGSNSSGSSNTALGQEALGSSTEASSNTGIGWAALAGNTEGEGNTAVGANVMWGGDYGDYNTAIGYGSYMESSTVDNSTAIGANAHADQDDCVILGNNADVGIKTSRPYEDLEVAGDGRAFFGDGGGENRKGLLIDGIQGDNAARIEAYNYGTSTGMNLVLNTTSTSGFVGIRRTDPSVSLDVSGSIEYTGTITDVSDERLKENFKSIENAVESISKLQGYSYNMIDDEEQVREYGVKAQEVQKVFPEMVSVVDTKEGYLGVSYIQLIPVLLEAIKELKEENELLRTEHVIQSDLIKSNTQLMIEMKELLSSSAQQ